jgi:fructan beta-fructosidase
MTTDDARDPKVVWHEPSQNYVMVLYRKTSEDDKSKGVPFIPLVNLTDWEYKSHVYGFYECPDLIPMQVTNRPEETKWVLFDGDGSYLIGNFDGENLHPKLQKCQAILVKIIMQPNHGAIYPRRWPNHSDCMDAWRQFSRYAF